MVEFDFRLSGYNQVSPGQGGLVSKRIALLEDLAFLEDPLV